MIYGIEYRANSLKIFSMKSQDFFIPDKDNRQNPSRLITLGDLFDFKRELVYELGQLLKEMSGQPTKRWLKSDEVMRFLKISSSTLQVLRNSKKLPYTKIGGVLYYDANVINALLAKASFNSSSENP